jgi:hypothetical protein
MTNLYTVRELAEARGTSWVIRDALLGLEAENIKLREALQYMSDNSLIDEDYKIIARAALGEQK